MRLLASALALTLLALASPIRAEPADEAAAKAHYLAGTAYYDQGNYDDAVKEFTEAHRLSNRPDLLYNIAVCQEKLRHWDLAIDHFKQYLQEKPLTPDRSDIEARIAKAEVQRDSERTQWQVTPPPPTHTPMRPLRITSLVLGSVGSALLISAMGTGIAAQVDYRHLADACPLSDCPNDPELQQTASRGHALAVATDVMLALGAASLVTGVVLFIVDLRRQHAKPRAAAPASALLPTLRF